MRFSLSELSTFLKFIEFPPENSRKRNEMISSKTFHSIKILDVQIHCHHQQPSLYVFQPKNQLCEQTGFQVPFLVKCLDYFDAPIIHQRFIFGTWQKFEFCICKIVPERLLRFLKIHSLHFKGIIRQENNLKIFSPPEKAHLTKVKYGNAVIQAFLMR